MERKYDYFRQTNIYATIVIIGLFAGFFALLTTLIAVVHFAMSYVLPSATIEDTIYISLGALLIIGLTFNGICIILKIHKVRKLTKTVVDQLDTFETCEDLDKFIAKTFDPKTKSALIVLNDDDRNALSKVFATMFEDICKKEAGLKQIDELPYSVSTRIDERASALVLYYTRRISDLPEYERIEEKQ